MPILLCPRTPFKLDFKKPVSIYDDVVIQGKPKSGSSEEFTIELIHRFGVALQLKASVMNGMNESLVVACEPGKKETKLPTPFYARQAFELKIQNRVGVFQVFLDEKHLCDVQKASLADVIAINVTGPLELTEIRH